MRLAVVLILAFCLAGCYSVAPDEGHISTVPVTNNHHVMPGNMKSNSLPTLF